MMDRPTPSFPFLFSNISVLPFKHLLKASYGTTSVGFRCEFQIEKMDFGMNPGKPKPFMKQAPLHKACVNGIVSDQLLRPAQLDPAGASRLRSCLKVKSLKELNIIKSIKYH